MFFFCASTVLKQTVAPHTSMPNQAGTFFLSRYWLMMASRFSGAYGSSMPCLSSSARLEAATPITTSACGLAFSASSLAVITPVESRTHLISMSGSPVEAFLVGLELVGLQRGVDQQLGLLGEGPGRENREAGKQDGLHDDRQAHGDSSWLEFHLTLRSSGCQLSFADC